MTEQEYKLHKWVKIWNILASIFFVFLCFVLYAFFLFVNQGNFQIGYMDIFILAFANYRLVRLFIYDNMTLFIREMFMDLKIHDGKYEYVHSKNSFKLTMHKLMTCPWCFGVWSTFVSGFIYFSIPGLKVFFILLAISSMASFLIILTNLIGWHAEGKKKQVETF